jgi:2-oxoisovalerate dehydrogenase E1 component
VAICVETGDRLTVVSWGAMVHRCVEAAAKWPGAIEVLDLRTIVPWDREAVLASVKKTGKCLVVHEDTRTGGFAGEIIATIAAEAFEHLDAPVRRLTTLDCPIPYHTGLMAEVIPGVEAVAAAMAGMLAF